MPAPETTTRPIPNGRYAAPDPAPNTPTECPRCGAPAISKAGVAKHELFHRAQDADARRQKALLDRLERFLDEIETNVDPETGQRLTLSQWIEQTDVALDDHGHVLDDLRERLRPAEEAPAAVQPEIIPWPGELTDAAPDEDETVEPDDRDADEIIPSSATHSFPGDGPADLPGYDHEPDPEPGAIAPQAGAIATHLATRDDDWDRL